MGPEASEDLNQIQHECLILQGLEWLRKNGFISVADWEWNPRQTGTSTEPDLRGRTAGEILISAEASASEFPKGLIDTRAPFTFEGNGVPPLQGTEMGHGVNVGLLTAYVEINLTIDGQAATSGSVGNVDQVLLTTVPEPSSIILATVGILPLALRRRLFGRYN